MEFEVILFFVVGALALAGILAIILSSSKPVEDSPMEAMRYSALPATPPKCICPERECIYKLEPWKAAAPKE